MVFTVRAKDGMGRIGILGTASGNVETPALMPVLNPRSLTIKPAEMVNLGAEIFITNSYLIYRDQETRDLVLEKGLHGYLGYDGPVMTDSGAFQLMLYGSVEVDNETITSFQEDIKTNIGVFLDVPVKGGKQRDYEQALDLTLERAREHVNRRRETNLLWAGPVQGGPFPDLVERAASEMSQLDFQIHALGSVVPLMEQYRYATVLEMILAAKKHLPTNRPLHLFGAGHPMLFAITAYLGCDLYDSAAYALFAKRDDYITPTGTRSLSEITYFPCSCPVCNSITPDELRKESKLERERLLALHNIATSLEEIRRVKQAMKEGRLLNLALERAKCHPELTKAFSTVFKSPDNILFIESHDTVAKSKALFITDPLLQNNPVIYRFQKKVLSDFYAWADRLIIYSNSKPKISQKNTQFISIHPVLGPLPDELYGVFPTLQFLTIDLLSDRNNESLARFLDKYSSSFKEIVNITENGEDSLEIPSDQVDNQVMLSIKENHIIRARIDYQFGKGASKGFEGLGWKVARTGIPRAIILDGEEIASVRASDQLILPNMKLARILKENIQAPSQRIVVNPEVKTFITEGRSVFAKHVITADPELRKGDHALIVTPSDELLAVGESLLSGWEITMFTTGLAAKNKKH